MQQIHQQHHHHIHRLKTSSATTTINSFSISFSNTIFKHDFHDVDDDVDVEKSVEISNRNLNIFIKKLLINC